MGSGEIAVESVDGAAGQPVYQATLDAE